MKVALCLHGLVGTDDKYGKGNKLINHKVGYRHFKEHVMDVNDQVDVFIHTWSVDQKDKVVETYSPIAIKAEPQPTTGLDRYSEEMDFHGVTTNTAGLHANYCRWRSVKEVISMVNSSHTEYDWILLTRFDIAFLVDFDFSTFDKDKFYAQGPAGPFVNGLHLINDLWFAATPKDMTLFATLTDKMPVMKISSEIRLPGSSGTVEMWEPRGPNYIDHVISNHQLARKHLLETGLHDKLEYKFLREWTGADGKLSCDTPLVRWHYMNKV